MPIRVLHLEDDPLDAQLVERELVRSALEARITRVASIPDFEAALRRETPDVILSDHGVPGSHGRRALDLARELAPHTPFILVTGSLSEDEAVGYMKAGAADYIIKDRMMRLVPALREALDRSAERRALARSERLVRQIVDANPSPIYVRDDAGAILLANRAGAELLGTTVEALANGALPSGAQAAADALFAADAAVLASGEPTTIPDHVVAIDGRDERHVQLVKVPLTAPGEDATRVLTVATDLTAYRRLESQLRQAQKMDAVGQLAGGVAHDFNNILTAILGHAELLIDQLADAPALRADVETIRGSAQQAASLTRQLLAFSRRQILRPRDIDLNRVIRDLEKMVRRLLAENIDVERFRLAPGLGTVRADPAQLSQVLVNLIVNARDAMPGGGSLTIRTANLVLDEHEAKNYPGAEAGSFVSIDVSDTGTGMSEATQARAFEPFFTTKEPGEGTGLGLSTAYGIVKQSGGWIWASSGLGKGSTFRICLPRVDAAESAADQDAEPRSAGGRETILIVEDAEPVRRLAVTVLRRNGYTVLEAGNGRDALRAARELGERIDLLLTDLVMPGISGADLARELSAERPSLRVLYTSGYTDDTILDHGLLSPGVSLLQKPFAVDDLLRAVRRMLDAPAGDGSSAAGGGGAPARPG